MTDRKLTEAELISYLELSVAIGSTARLAPEEAQMMLDLINRYKEEVKKIKSECQAHRNTVIENEKRFLEFDIEQVAEINRLESELKTAKSEAVNEFAESLKEKAYPFPCAIGVEWAVPFVAIDTLVKEMTK